MRVKLPSLTSGSERVPRRGGRGWIKRKTDYSDNSDYSETSDYSDNSENNYNHRW